MPRRVIKRLMPRYDSLTRRWFLRPFAALLGDPAIWATHRRSVIKGLTLGIAVSFVPFPVHTALAALLALWLRVNLPAAALGSWFSNPLTFVPIYYGGYRLGAALLGGGDALGPESFSSGGVRDAFGAIWAPLLLGCAVLSAVTSATIYLVLNRLWIAAVRRSFRTRRTPWRP